jgi:cytochrome c oxidase subunit I+III
VKLTAVVVIGGIVALASIFMWLWQTDPEPTDRLYDIGGGIKLPDYVSGKNSHSWWAMVVLMLVDGSIFVCLVFTFFFLWTVDPAGWPPSGLQLAVPGSSLLAAAAWVASAAALWVANKALGRKRTRAQRVFDPLMILAVAAMWAAVALNFHALWAAGIRPEAHGYAATVFTMLAWQALHATLLTLMAGYTLARRWAGLLDARRRNTFDNTRIMAYYSAVQAIIALLVVHSPRLAG